MARKKASKYAKLGKKSKGRRGFQGRKAEANSSAGNIDFSVESGTITTTDAVTHLDEIELVHQELCQFVLITWNSSIH